MPNLNSEKLLSVVIVNYFSEALTANCIRSILKNHPTGKNSTDFVIVDNGSKVHLTTLLNPITHASVIRPGANLGFAKGVNLGIRLSCGRYILSLNPDVEVCDHALDKAVEFMESPENQKVAILGPKVYDEQEKRSVQLSARSFPGFAQSLFSRYSMLTKMWPKNPWSRRYLKNDGAHNMTTQVDWVSGCCMLIRRAAVEQIGMFDERYFMYVEDVDLCRRAWMQGWEVVYFPEAEVIHQVGASSRHRAIRMIVEHHRSMWIYYQTFSAAGVAAKAVVFLGICTRAAIVVIGTLAWGFLRGLASFRASFYFRDTGQPGKD